MKLIPWDAWRRSNFTPNPNVGGTSGVTISGSYAHIIGVFGLNIVTCEVNVNDGTLSNCFGNGNILNSSFNAGIAVLNDYLYVSSEQNQVEKCIIGNNGGISGCESTGSGFVAPSENMTFITR